MMNAPDLASAIKAKKDLKKYLMPNTTSPSSA